MIGCSRFPVSACFYIIQIQQKNDEDEIRSRGQYCSCQIITEISLLLALDANGPLFADAEGRRNNAIAETSSRVISIRRSTRPALNQLSAILADIGDARAYFCRGRTASNGCCCWHAIAKTFGATGCNRNTVDLDEILYRRNHWPIDMGFWTRINHRAGMHVTF